MERTASIDHDLYEATTWLLPGHHHGICHSRHFVLEHIGSTWRADLLVHSHMGMMNVEPRLACTVILSKAAAAAQLSRVNANVPSFLFLPLSTSPSHY